MKIKKLIIQNINSIYGTWAIDFQHEDYVNNPLFAIVGKTGSGKSSILDAICFALYDQTDRMEKSRGAIASYHTKECMAELEFELNGKTYISHTSMSCNSKDGLFDNGINNSWIQCGEDKVDGTSRKCSKVSELLGLDFVQFRRVILLAQGKFNAFLTEAPDKRADILENITGTEIYSRIGNKIHAMRTEKENAQKEIETALELIQVLPTEKKEEKLKRLEEIHNEEVQVNHTIKAIDGFLSAAQKTKEAEEALNKLKQEEVALMEREKAFDVERSKLKAGMIASRITPSFNDFETIRKDQERDEKEKNSVLDGLPVLKKNQEDAKNVSESEEANFQKIASIRQTREAFLNGVDNFDKELVRLGHEAMVNENAQKKAMADKEKCDREIARLNQQIGKLQIDKKTADDYLESHQRDAELAVEKVAWDASFNAIFKARTYIDTLKQKEKSEQIKLDLAVQKAKEAKETFTRKADEKANAEKAKAIAEEELTIALGTHSLEALEVAKNKQTEIVSILTALKPHEVLKTFEEGSHCPVCGATHHPYRQENFDESPELKAAKNLLKQEKAMYEKAKKASEAVAKATLNLTKAESEWIIAQAQTVRLDEDLSAKKDSMAVLVKERKENEINEEAQCLRLKGELADFGFEWNGSELLSDVISKRNLEYIRQKTLSDGFEKQQDSLKAQLAGLQGELAGRGDALDNATAQLAKTNTQRDDVRRKRQDAYQDKKTDDERKSLQEQYSNALNQRDSAAKSYANAVANVENCEKRIDVLTLQINNRKAEFIQKEQKLNNLLLVHDLTVEKYLSTRLEQGEMTRLVTEETTLAGIRENLDRNMKEQLRKREDNIQCLPGDFDLRKTEIQKADLQAKLSELAAERGGIQQELTSNNENTAHADKLQNDLINAKNESERWGTLDNWLGGQRFKRLAQSYTFEILLGKANEQLHNMLNGRYMMCSHGEDGNLEIDVVDNQLGGDIRTSKNLSGGEQFIISMALALGLASMVGEKLRIDSLFLDEGFGTLDGNELEEAMNTLAQLKGNGKLVGIITHAERLQERIATRISVEKQGNGQSVLDGPGVCLVAPPKMFINQAEKKRRMELEKQKKAEAKRLMKLKKNSNS